MCCKINSLLCIDSSLGMSICLSLDHMKYAICTDLATAAMGYMDWKGEGLNVMRCTFKGKRHSV